MALFFRALGRLMREHLKAGILAVVLCGVVLLGWRWLRWALLELAGDRFVQFVNTHPLNLGSWMVANPIASAVIVGVLFVVACSFLATRDELVRKFAEFTREPDIPTLEILWKPGEHGYRHEYMLPPDPEVKVHFRLCVLNVSKRTHVSNIRATLDLLEPRELACVPCCLRLMNNMVETQAPIETFDLNPGDKRFIDFMAHGPNANRFWIWHTVPAIPVTVPAQHYTFTILVTSRNAAPVLRQFELIKDGLFWSIRTITPKLTS